jgi:hypothetical protein
VLQHDVKRPDIVNFMALAIDLRGGEGKPRNIAGCVGIPSLEIGTAAGVVIVRVRTDLRRRGGAGASVLAVVNRVLIC